MISTKKVPRCWDQETSTRFHLASFVPRTSPQWSWVHPAGQRQKNIKGPHMGQIFASTRLVFGPTFLVWKASFKNSEKTTGDSKNQTWDVGNTEDDWSMVWSKNVGWTKQVKSSGSAYQTWLQKPSVPSFMIFQPRVPRTMAQSHLTNRHVFGAWQCRGVVLLLRSSLFWWNICISSRFFKVCQFSLVKWIISYICIYIYNIIIYIYICIHVYIISHDTPIKWSLQKNGSPYPVGCIVL